MEILAYRLLSHWNGRKASHVVASFGVGFRVLNRIKPNGTWRGHPVRIIGELSRPYHWQYVQRWEKDLTTIMLDESECAMFPDNEIFEGFYDK